MKSSNPYEVDLIDLVVAELARDGYRPREIRRILATANALLVRYVQEGYVVRIRGAFRVWGKPLQQRDFRSNLPALRNRRFLSKRRAKLCTCPEGQLKQYLKAGLIDDPIPRH